MPKPSSELMHRIQKQFPQVTRIIDSTEPVEVHVTKADGRKGKVLKNAECALARACKRQFGIDGAMINLSISYLISGHTAVRFKTPETVAREIISFDRSKDFSIGTYRLSVVSNSARLGQGRWKPTGKGPRKARSRALVHYTARVRGRKRKER